MADSAQIDYLPLAERLLDAEEFQRIIEAGVFAEEDRKLELDEGRIVVAPVDGGPHLNIGKRFGRLWYPRIVADPALGSRLDLFIPGAVRVTNGVVRAPDAMLAPPGTVGKQRWPSAKEVLLAIEFSDTTLRYDDGKKRSDYALGGVQEVWIVRVEQEDVRVCRGPQADGSWREAELHSGDAVLQPLAALELAIRARELFED